MHNLLTRHISDSNMQDEKQFRFGKILTSEEASYDLSNYMVSALDNESVQWGILYELTRISDCVHHDTSLIKLNFYKKTGKANEWTKSYFRDRYQSVEVNLKMSITMHFYTGELQIMVLLKDQCKFS